MKSTHTLLLSFITIILFIISLQLLTIGKDLHTIASPPVKQQNYFDISSVYYNGEILLPDYAHDDTLVVFNAKELNRMFDGIDLPIPATDEEVDEVLHMYAISVNQRLIDILPNKDSTFSATIEITH